MTRQILMRGCRLRRSHPRPRQSVPTWYRLRHSARITSTRKELLCLFVASPVPPRFGFPAEPTMELCSRDLQWHP